jgi:hypothetical protein
VGAAGDAGKTFTQADIDAATAKANREAAAARTELKTLKDAQLTADEKKAAEVKEREEKAAARETAATERLTSAAIREAAAAAGVPAGSLALIPRLIDRADVEYDDDGEPKNVAALVAKLLKDHPQFAATSGGGGGAGSADGGSRGGGKPLTIEEVRKMPAAEINRRWDEVQKVLAKPS